MSVADAAVIVVNGKAGVEVGTIKAWEICERRRIPRIFFVTNMDSPNAKYMETVEQLKEHFGKKVAPFHLPILENDKLTGYVNVVKMGGRKFLDDAGNYTERDIPDSVKPKLEPVREQLMEAVAESDEELMDKYFAGEEFTYEEISKALRKSVISCDIVPVQIGSGVSCQGVNSFLQTCEKYFPSANKAEVLKKATNVDTGEEVVADFDCNKPVSAYVFKTIMDPFVGKYSLVKVRTGILKAGDTVYNLSLIHILRGQESDRVAVIANELKKIGCDTEIIEVNGRTDVKIVPGKLHGAEIETYDDHRVAMSFSLIGLLVEGIVIKNPLCCKKTFENYFEVLDEITK